MSAGRRLWSNSGRSNYNFHFFRITTICHNMYRSSRTSPYWHRMFRGWTSCRTVYHLRISRVPEHMWMSRGAPEPAQLKRSAASSECGLDERCGPITVDPVISTPTSTSTASLSSATTCVVRDAGPIGFECFTSGPHKGQCITILCLEHPDTCGCPGTDVGKRSEVIGHYAFLHRYLLRPFLRITDSLVTERTQQAPTRRRPIHRRSGFSRTRR